jgi:hypothetical protein
VLVASSPEQMLERLEQFQPRPATEKWIDRAST